MTKPSEATAELVRVKLQAENREQDKEDLLRTPVLEELLVDPNLIITMDAHAENEESAPAGEGLGSVSVESRLGPDSSQTMN